MSEFDLPKYCSHCGAELVAKRHYSGYNTQTGNKTYNLQTLRCPNKKFLIGFLHDAYDSNWDYHYHWYKMPPPPKERG